MATAVRILWVVILVIALYTAWIFWQRHGGWSHSQQVETDPMGKYGKGVKILQFYAKNQEIAPGASTLLCYGVVNATTLRLEPPAEKVWPAVTRCFNVTPRATTQYTLTAEGADHASVSQSIEIVVKAR